jgi:hypothetical protein
MPNPEILIFRSRLCSSFQRRLESSSFFAFDVVSAELPRMSAGNFFAGAKKSPRNTFSYVEGVFAECPSLAMQRTAHILCALAGDVADVSERDRRQSFSSSPRHSRERGNPATLLLLFHL